MGPQRGGETGAAGRGGRKHLRMRENPAPETPRAGAGGQQPDPPGQAEESVALGPPQRWTEALAACGADGTRGQMPGAEEAKAGPGEPQLGSASLLGFGPGPGDESQV